MPIRSRGRIFSIAALGTLSLLLAGCANSGSDANNAANGANPSEKKGLLSRVLESAKPITVPEGTAIAITTDQALSSEDNHSGDTFDATVAEPVIVDGKTVIPKGARAKGTVVNAKSSGRLKSPGQLEISLSSVEVGGESYPINTNDASRTGKGHTKHNAIFIGGGTAAGALIGGLAGGGKGALIGGALGAGGGTAAAAATGKMKVQIPAETRLTFSLAQPVTIKVKS